MDTQSSFRYAHLADLHLGSWRDSALRELSTSAFDLAIQTCINRKYDFVLFAGDIFNTALPSIDIVNHIAKKLQELKLAQIPLYVIPGSHDFSPTNKSMIDVLENAGLLINVCKGKINPISKQLELRYTIDPRTNAKITGILGRRGMLDRSYYENLARSMLENETGYKIFMFHTTLTELKPKHLEMLDSQAASFLPKNQNYYPGGHIHHKSLINLDGYGPMAYTGPLFPNNFFELEKYSFGGFYEIKVHTINEAKKINHSNQKNHQQKHQEDHQKDHQENYPKYQQTITWLPLKIKEHHAFKINCTNKTKEQIHLSFQEFLSNTNVKNCIITLRIFGKIGDFQIKDLDLAKLYALAQEYAVYVLLVNTNKIERAEFNKISLALNLHDHQAIESELIKEHLISNNQELKSSKIQFIENLLTNLNSSKKEGEKSYDFSNRIIENCQTLFNRDNID